MLEKLSKELDKEKLAAIIELKYKTVIDAKKVLGDQKLLEMYLLIFNVIYIKKQCRE